MLLDHFIMTLVVVLVGIPFLAVGSSLQRYLDLDLPWFVGGLLFSIYVSKDIFHAKSPAKRLLGLQVVDRKTGEAASPFKFMIRNLTCVLGPCELLIALFSPARRLGDVIANTRVVSLDSKPR